MTSARNGHCEACDEIDCHCEDQINWEEHAATQAAWNLAQHTAQCFGYSHEIIRAGDEGAWIITITCDPERRHQHFEPKKIGTLFSDEHHLAYGCENVDKLITKLKLLKRSEFTETLQDGYGFWTITAYWTGALVNDPRWPMRAEAPIQ